MTTTIHTRGAWADVRAPGLDDQVAVEEPLEIRVDGRAVAVTMRTPGDDESLALGFLFGEGLIDGPRAAGPPADFAANTVEVEVEDGFDRERLRRNFYTTSSCGVCGKGALVIATWSTGCPRLAGCELMPPSSGRGCVTRLPSRSHSRFAWTASRSPSRCGRRGTTRSSGPGFSSARG